MTTSTHLPFPQYLDDFRSKLQHVLHVRSDIDRLSMQRGLPPFVLREIMSCNPMSVFIPEQYGGRGGNIREGVALLSAASYESLALSLTFGINWALFLQPVGKYGREEIRQPIFDGFLIDKKMGGLMITEPEYGSDALHMQTSCVLEENHYRLEGVKHWAGLTGWADYWLLTARQMNDRGELGRDIEFFVCDVTRPGQDIVVEEFFDNLGLYVIPYGRNRIDVTIPKTFRLEPKSSGVKMMLDLLHRSRLQFPGMGLGFIQRMLDESLQHSRDRLVGNRHLGSYDQVQSRLVRLQSAFTVCSAMCDYGGGVADPVNDLAGAGLMANVVKTVVTDLMQESAQSALQLLGAKGYRLSHIVGRGTVDSRPFQIFEGSNDILYIQIGEAILKGMKRARETNLGHYLNTFEPTARAADRLGNLLDVSLTDPPEQRRLYELGRIVSRVIAMQLVEELGDKGFRPELVANSLAVLHAEIAGLMQGVVGSGDVQAVEDYRDRGSWFNLPKT